jgi:hypothetical protein
MKRFVLAALLSAPLTAAAQTTYVCGMGTVLDVQFVAGHVISVIVRTKRPEYGGPGLFEIMTQDKPDPTYFVTVNLRDVLYTAQSSATAAWNLDPTQFRADQAVSVCVNDTTMILDRLDGKDYRARVVRVVRRPKTATTDRR